MVLVLDENLAQVPALRPPPDRPTAAENMRPDDANTASCAYATADICHIWYVASVNAFAVLAQPQRRRILDMLLDGERPVSDLVDQLEMSQPTVSKHLRVLRDAGMVAVRVDAQRRVYRVEPSTLAEIDAWLAPYRRLWAQRLDALEAHLRDQENK